MSRRGHRAAAMVTAWVLIAGNPLAAQTTGSVNLGASWGDYEGYLGSGAAYVTPTLRYNAPSLSLGASGSLVIFESGNRILQGLAAGAWRTRLHGRFRAEISGSAGVNVYADNPGYGHLLGRARFHFDEATIGAWVGTSTGQSYVGVTSTTPFQIELGGWTVYHGVAVNAVATRSWFADTAYLDIVATAIWSDQQLSIDGSLGFRTWSNGGGNGVYGELQLGLPVSRRLVALVAGGRYPSDPIRGVIAANYVSVGLRIEAFNARSSSPTRVPRTFLRKGEDPPRPAAGEAHLTIGTSSEHLRSVRIEAPGAESVQLSGDFTDWRAVSLSRTRQGYWEIMILISPGVHRANVRLNGGPWIVPLGLRAEEDEFGGHVGILIIP